MRAQFERWKREEHSFLLLIIAEVVAAYFFLILLMEFQPGDDLQTVTLARHSSFTAIFTSSVYNWGEYYRPLILFITKLLITPSFSVLPYRIVLAATGLGIFGLALRSLQHLGVSRFGLALAAFFLIGSPYTFGTFSWWADMGGRHIVLGFMTAAFFITANKPFPKLIAFPVLALCLLSQETALALALLYCVVFLLRRDYTGAAGVVLLVAAYFALRFAVIGTLFSEKGLFLQLPQGFFFESVTSKEQWQGMFRGWYHLLYVYNVVAQFFAVFFAEPHSGLLSFAQWRHVVPFVVQTASTVVLGTVFYKQRDRRMLLVAGLFLLVIIGNVLVGFGSTRFRTLAVSGTAYMILFAWAADTVWKSWRSGSSRWPRWTVALVALLFIGWGGQAALRLADMTDEVKDQDKTYALDVYPPGPEIDGDLYQIVKARHLRR